VKVPIREEDTRKSFYKYYELEIASLTTEQMATVADAKGDPADALPLMDRNRLFDPGDLPDEFGYYLMPDGTLQVACRTDMPGVTGDMLKWWFDWHGIDSFRYSIWDPEDHFGVTVESEKQRARLVDPSIPVGERIWGVTHVVDESIGGPPTKIVIMFAKPGDLGYDQTKVDTELCDFLCAANALIVSDGPKVPVVMTHMARTVAGVLQFRSRFWIGWHIVDMQPVKLLPDGITVPSEIGIGLLGHNIKEYGHLAKILPQLYAEEKDNW
jgi:hypothetical protein